MTKKRKRIIIAIAVLTPLLCVAGFFYMASQAWKSVSVDVDMSNEKTRASVEKVTGLTFPASARWEHAYYEGWLDYFFHCRFQIPANRLPELFDDQPFEWSTTERFVGDAKKLRWFRPDSIERFRSGRMYNKETHVWINVLYDDSKVADHEWITVYLAWNSH